MNTGEVSNVLILRHLCCVYIQKIIFLSKRAKGHPRDDNKKQSTKSVDNDDDNNK